MLEIQNLHRAREVDVDKMLQAVTPIRQGDPLLGRVHAHLGPLPAQLLSQLLQRVEPCQIAHAVTGLSECFFSRSSWLRIEDHPYVHHASVYLGAIGTLHKNARGISAHIGAGFPRRITVPLPWRSRSKYGTL